jgi:Glycosyltransferase family 87
VMAADPCDPFKAPANFPGIWMAAAFLGLGPGNTVVLGYLSAAVFLVAAVAVVPARARPYEAGLYGLALCSPAVMLGVERGNVDILLFALVVLAALLFRRDQRSTIVAHGLILFAALLKLYPIFAAGMLLRQSPRRALTGVGLVVGLFAVYVIAIRSEIRTLIRVTPQLDDLSYGLRLVSEWLAAVTSLIFGSTLAWLRLRDWNGGLAIVIVAAAVVVHRGGRRHLPLAPGADVARDLDLFVAGAGVYVCTYVLFNSFDYRLVFVLLTLPQLLRWARERQPVALVSLTAAFGTLWLDPSLTARLPLLGSATRHWNHLTTFAAFDGVDRALSLAVIMQLILFCGLVGCLVAMTPTELPRPALRRSVSVR